MGHETWTYLFIAHSKRLGKVQSGEWYSLIECSNKVFAYEDWLSSVLINI